MKPNLHVVVVTSELPFPLTAGNRIRTLHLASRLARRHRVVFLAHRNDEAEEAARHLKGLGMECHLVNRVVPPKSGPMFYARLVGNLAARDPYSVAAHASPALRRAASEYASRHDVDLWQAEATAVFGTLDDVGQAPRLVIAHNVESLIWQRYVETEPSPLRRWYIHAQWRKFERFERRTYAAADRVVAVSDEDARLIREEYGGRRVDVVDNGIDRASYAGLINQGDPRRILFLGSLDYRPNQDAVATLLDRVFPAVRAQVPDARLVLVGRRPPSDLAARASRADGVELHADVPDVGPYLTGSGVLAVPLRIGGGSRLKILEAMAVGLPVISTRVGAEGLDARGGEHFTAADDPEAMADALVAVIRDPGPARAMAEKARALTWERYDWDVLADRLEASWRACLDDRASGRGAARP